MPASNGGTLAQFNIVLLPATTGGVTGVMFTYSVVSFNDASSPSSYSWKVEDVIPGRNPTIGRVWVSYRDLGLVATTWTLSGTTDNQTVTTRSNTVTLGNAVATNVIMTKDVGLSLTGQNLQLSVFRAAAAGPLSITKVFMEGSVEMAPMG